MANEHVGGIEMEGVIDLGPAEKSTKSYLELLQKVDKQMGVTEKGFGVVEQKSKAAAGSIEDLNNRAKKLKDQLAKLDPETKQFTNTAKSLNVVLSELKYAQDKATKSTVAMQQGFKDSKLASQALGVTLGLLGAQSVEAVIFKMVQLGRQSIDLAINLQAVENRARAIYGDAFPRMMGEFDAMGEKMHRSSSDLLEFGTGFAFLMDSMGMSGQAINKYSGELTQLTVTLGKAFPDKSDADVYGIIEAGILGNVRGLKQLGISMKDDQLQRFATSEGIKLLVKDMDDEQLMMLRTKYLLQETTKQQLAGANATGALGDKAKTTGAAWHDLNETLGQTIGPVVAKGLDLISTALQWAAKNTKIFKDAWNSMAFSVANAIPGGKLLYGAIKVAGLAKGAMGQGDLPTRVGTGPISGPVFGPSASSSFSAESPDFWKNKGTGGGGGKDAAEERKKVEEQILKIEEDILKTYGEQAKGNLDSLTARREDLELRKKIGSITASESKELDRINHRHAFQKDLVQETTKALDDQVKALEDVDDKIKGINEKMADERADLKQSLADIDRDTGRSKVEKAADLIRDLKALDDKLARGEGNSEEDQRKRKEIQDSLSTVDASTVAAGKDIAALNPFQDIDRQATQKKADAQAESDARIAGFQTELAEAQRNRAQIVSLEAEKRHAVEDALAARAAATSATYRQIDAETTAHVNTQLAELARLNAGLANPAPVKGAVKRAAGGMVYGPGGPTGDKIPAWLSDGEGIIKTAAVNHYGGPGFINAINSLRLHIPRFAAGGVVSQSSVNNARTANITVHNHGPAASAWRSPSRLRFETRLGMR